MVASNKGDGSVSIRGGGIWAHNSKSKPFGLCWHCYLHQSHFVSCSMMAAGPQIRAALPSASSSPCLQTSTCCITGSRPPCKVPRGDDAVGGVCSAGLPPFMLALLPCVNAQLTVMMDGRADPGRFTVCHCPEAAAGSEHGPESRVVRCNAFTMQCPALTLESRLKRTIPLRWASTPSS